MSVGAGGRRGVALLAGCALALAATLPGCAGTGSVYQGTRPSPPGTRGEPDALPGWRWYAATLTGAVPVSAAVALALELVALPVTGPAWAITRDDRWQGPITRALDGFWIEVLGYDEDVPPLVPPEATPGEAEIPSRVEAK